MFVGSRFVFRRTHKAKMVDLLDLIAVDKEAFVTFVLLCVLITRTLINSYEARTRTTYFYLVYVSDYQTMSNS